MNEIIQKVAERAGIDSTQAEKAIGAVLEQLEGRLPGPIASQVRGILSGDAGSSNDAEKGKGLMGGLGKVLGR